jgi:hypothetical protein
MCAERAKRMRGPLALPAPTSPEALRETLIQHGTTVVQVLSQPEVLATYRLAILNVEIAPDVALTLDKYGRADTTTSLMILFQEVCDRGLLRGAEPAAMAELFFGILMQSGILVRMLMRVAPAPTEVEARHRAEVAVSTLERLYGEKG